MYALRVVDPECAVKTPGYERALTTAQLTATPSLLTLPTPETTSTNEVLHVFCVVCDSFLLLDFIASW